MMVSNQLDSGDTFVKRRQQQQQNTHTHAYDQEFIVVKLIGFLQHVNT